MWDYLGLRFVVSFDEPHKLGHAVTVEVWRTEGVLVHRPPWREDDKVNKGATVNRRRAGQHSEDGRILREKEAGGG
jgi:hypothetical protein